MSSIHHKQRTTIHFASRRPNNIGTSTVKHDLHISALTISPASRGNLENLGFVRDEFANNRRCIASEYHASYKGNERIPNDALWGRLSNLLFEDDYFSGHLEEEQTVRRESIASARTTPWKRRPLVPFKLEPVPPGR